MSQTSVYIGYSTHWGLHALRKDLAIDVISKWALDTRPVRQGLLLDRDSPKGRILNELIGKYFAEWNNPQRNSPSFLYPIIDMAIDVETIFIHTVLSTGTTSLLYHGDDEHTPQNLTWQKGKELVGDRFTKIDFKLLDTCRSEVNQLFPELMTLVRNDLGLTNNDKASLMFLQFALVDILISLRTNSRILLLNPKPVFDKAIQRLPAKCFSDLNAFYDIFQRQSGYVASPTPDYDVAGLNKEELFGSERFMEYCRAHDMLNMVDSRIDGNLEVLSRNVVALSERYDKFVQRKPMNFLLVEAIEKLASLFTHGVSDNMSDFAGILVKLCKEYERSLVFYSGQNLKEFCERLVNERLMGGEKNPSLVSRLMGRLRSTFS